MQKPDFEAEAHFSQPFRQIAMMLVVLGLCGAGGFIALPRVLPVFQANPWLNGFIAFVFVLGVVACFLQVAQLIQSVRWIETFLADRDAGAQPPRLLACSLPFPANHRASPLLGLAWAVSSVRRGLRQRRS